MPNARCRFGHHQAPPAAHEAGRPVIGQPSDGRAARGPAAGNLLTAAVLLAIVLGGTLPVPLYVRYEQQFGSGRRGHRGLRRLPTGHPVRAGSAG
jgi:hypothetical protein